MKKLLLITGDLATGKSTFANILSKTLIRETHYPNLWRIAHKDWG